MSLGSFFLHGQPLCRFFLDNGSPFCSSCAASLRVGLLSLWLLGLLDHEFCCRIKHDWEHHQRDEAQLFHPSLLAEPAAGCEVHAASGAPDLLSSTARPCELSGSR